MPTYREQKLSEIIRELASKFLLEEGSGASLITVTKVEMRNDMKNAIIFFTVFPENKEKTALSFAKRKRSDFRLYLKKHSLISRLPFIDFEIDLGEKNRQQIDDLSRN